MANTERLGSDEIERYINRYNDLAAEVIVKEALLCDGVAFASPLVETSFAGPWRSIHLSGGEYQLLSTIVRPPINENSRFVIDQHEGGLVLRDRLTKQLLADARAYPADPSYLERRFDDAVSWADVVQPDGEVLVSERCPFSDVSSCPICSTKGVFVRRSALGEQRIHVRNPRAVGQAAFDAYAMEDWPDQEGPLRISLCAGRFPSTYEQVAEEDFFADYLGEVINRVHHRFRALLTMSAKSPAGERRLFDLGLSARAIALGVWDQQLFEARYGALNSAPHRNELLEWLLAAADTYGVGAVMIDLDAGAEIACGRFERPSDAISSMKAGMAFLSSHGCVPRLFHWKGEPQGGVAPDLDYFLEVDRAFYETWVVAQAFEPHTFIMGVGRNRFPYSAAWDVGRGGPPELARQWNADLLGQPGFRVPTGSTEYGNPYV